MSALVFNMWNKSIVEVWSKNHDDHPMNFALKLSVTLKIALHLEMRWSYDRSNGKALMHSHS